jgi:sigma-B regulation protein RsbU (phosphoserine phosphatase)
MRELMRRNINRKTQARLVGELNRQFTALAQLSRFATAVIGTYLANRDQLTLCNAGHPRPLWYRAQSREWRFVDSEDSAEGSGLTNLPFGIDESTSYLQATLDLTPGDVILIYTDALTESTGPDGKMLGEQGLLELTRSLDATTPAALPQALIDRLYKYRGGRQPGDDCTFLLLHHNARNSGRLSLRQKLDVYAKVFRLKSV